MKLQEHIRGMLHDGLVNIFYKTLKERQQMERQINKCFCIQCFYTVLETMNLAYGSLEMEKK